MKDKDKSFLNNFPSSDGINLINQNPEFQLRVIKHFFPQVTTGKKFKLHDENTPSSTLKLDNGKYWIKNFGTGQKAMDWLNITEDQLGYDTPNALKYALNNIVGDFVSPRKPTPIKKDFNSFQKRIYAIENNSKKEAEKYLVSRKIDINKLPDNAFFQSNTPDGKPNSIAFFDSERKLINERKLNGKKGQYKNTGQLYNSIYDRLYKPTEDWVFLVEGCINSLSIPEQSSLAFFSADNNFSAYKKLQPYLRGKTVVLAFDGDDAGEKISQKLLSLIANHELTEKSVLRLLLPNDKDLNDLLRNGELNQFLENPDNFKQLHPVLLENSEDEIADFEEKGFFKRNHRYWVKSTVKGKTVERHISNFIMEIIYFFPDGTDNAMRIFNLQTFNGKTALAQIPAKSLNLISFKSAIKSVEGLSFKGTINDLDNILEDLFNKELKASEISILGYNTKHDFYAYSNGIYYNGIFHPINELGVVGLPHGHFYLPALSKLNYASDNYSQEKMFIFREGEYSFHSWAKLFIDAYGEKGLIGIIFLCAAVFRDIIFKKLQFFPYLFLFGDALVGKTSYTEIILSLFYSSNTKIYKGISLESGSTAKAIARNVNKLKNGLIYLKEYTSNLHPELLGMLKTGYEGVGYSRAQKTHDNRTHDTFFNSAVIIDGNSIPSYSSALLSRMIVLDFRKDKFSDEQIEAYETLRNGANKGFGKVLIEILSKREHFISHFEANLRESEQQIREIKEYQSFSIRSIKHMSLFLAVFKSLNPVLRFPFSYEELFKCIENIIVVQDQEVEGLSRVNKFFEALDFLKSEGQIKKGIHYTYATRTNGQEYIALKLDLLHRLYLKNASTHDGEIARKNDLIRLIHNDPAYIPSWMKGRNNSVTVKGFGSAYAFDPQKINLNLNLWEK